MNRKAILVFADSVGLDLARRRLPQALRPLFGPLALEQTEAGADVHVFSTAGAGSGPGYTFRRQRGRSFAERLETAVEEVAALGYEEIVIVGQDCPRLSATDIATAFAALENQRLVLGPDHRGGCYLIGLKSADRGFLRGVQWRRNTDLEQLRDRCTETEVSLLPIKEDLDSWADLKFLAREGDRIGRIAAQLLLVANFVQALDHFVDLALQRVRVRGQMPPPAFD